MSYWWFEFIFTLVSESFWFVSQFCLLLLIICLKNIFQCLATSVSDPCFLPANPYHTHLIFSDFGFYSTVILRTLNTSGPLKGWTKSRSRENRMVNREIPDVSLFTIEEQKKTKTFFIIQLDTFLFPFKLLKLRSMTFCTNNKQPLLRLPSSHSSLCTLAKEQRVRKLMSRNCAGPRFHHNLWHIPCLIYLFSFHLQDYNARSSICHVEG